MKKMFSFLLVVLCVCLILGTAFATCSHIWSNWKQIGMWHQEPITIAGCELLVEELERSCSECGAVETTEIRTQLPHIWEQIDSYTKRCARCGLTTVLTK